MKNQTQTPKTAAKTVTTGFVFASKTVPLCRGRPQTAIFPCEKRIKPRRKRKKLHGKTFFLHGKNFFLRGKTFFLRGKTKKSPGLEIIPPNKK